MTRDGEQRITVGRSGILLMNAALRSIQSRCRPAWDTVLPRQLGVSRRLKSKNNLQKSGALIRAFQEEGLVIRKDPSSKFPFSDRFKVGEYEATASEIISALAPLNSDERLKKMQMVR